MPENQRPVVQLIDTNTVTGIFEYLSIQAQIGDEEQQDLAAKTLGYIIEGLPSDGTVTFDDALTIQALAISLGVAIRECADDPVKVRGLVVHLLSAVSSVATVLENLTGARVNDRRFFEHQPANTSVQ
ncbi:MULTISPECIES: hypothetical protein [unclassified Rhizobium]|uniref:hypothetical protein n=1 Tax=unclassified Rhizobium TaxID=2613769 RepID=UPI001ADAD215|nr:MULTISPECIES: hypothetical protein [unclassified Rhizobium]MBO9122797.1 hypothetical protein [Rhizobium sp. 16-488-2b]MBO9173329.1 hypothetical protein [Rhizobium sp. 16-488-2a]